ncbi:MAG TPA: ATPase, partial [Actinobacteria bacterium]|nr:ATPase [Actinomycetota bacterium]
MNGRPAFFETLRDKAVQRWDQLERDPELAGPWHQLFKQVQSPRHVLSELLQNADDAGATEASVDITDGCFIFAHNGEDFTEEHFASLCRFGYSNKRALHTIGFRGIGFKSTFSLGDTVELHTPTLTVAFHRQRFTEPAWVDLPATNPNRTVVRVVMNDERRRREVQLNLQEWLDSPVSLLFFKHIRCLRIAGHGIGWESLGPGPVRNTEWMGMLGSTDKKYLVVRSSAEQFPQDSLTEIRQERMLGVEQDADFPPCKVEIVLGVSGRLYVVLPTGVKTTLPFACNAPFIQDPARLKIKDPETSPTNRWLLERAGSLAADAMAGWLQQGSMDLAERAGAYALLPDVDFDDNSLEGVCATTVEGSFRAQLDDAEYVLTDAANLTTAGQSVVIPEQLCDVWPADTVAGFLDAAARPAFATTAFDSDRDKLLRWGAIEAISSDQFLAVLQSVHLPRPKTWRRLLSLWAYVAPDITKYSPKVDAKKVRIFPVQGKDEMYSAEEIVRLGERRLLQSDEDWDFLANHLLVLNQNWIRFLAEERRGAADEKPDVGLQQEIHAAHSMLKTTGLDDASDVSKVIEKVAAAFFAQQSVPIADCVRIAQIASKLGATLGPSFQFVTRDNRRHGISAVIIFDPSGSLEDLLPETWRQQHFLHPDYTNSFTSCTSEEWLQWTTTGRSRISMFAPLTKKKTPLRGRANAMKEVARRGFSGTPWRPFVTSQYVIDDWDFDDDLWRHWAQLSLSDERVWHQIMELVLAQSVSFWKSASSASVLQVATTGNTRSITSLPLLPDWILKFRDLPCLPDTRGSCRKPADLLRRAPETESLIDVEPFIHGKLDTESHRPLLTLLGVRNTPTGPDRLLNCLRALAKSETPPIHEVEKWYLRLDQMTDACSTEDLANITQALLEERIVLTENCGWA